MQANYFQNKSSLIFYKFFSLVLGFSVLFGLFVWTLYPKIFIIWQNFLAQLEYNCGCASHFSFQHHPWLLSSMVFLGLVSVFLISYLSIRIIKIRRQTKKFIKGSLKTRRRFLSPKLDKVAKIVSLQGKIIEINEQKPTIFCYGYFRPMVCISTILVKKLSESELTSVLQHEKYHLVNHDPIKLFLIKVTSKILFFVPGLKILAKQYMIFSELAADESATKNFANKAPLAQALAKIIYWHQRVITKANLAVSFFDAVLPERINKLSDDNYEPKPGIVAPKLIINSFLLFIIFASFGVLVNSGGAAMSSGANNSCSAPEPAANQCQMTGENVCVMGSAGEEHYCQN